MSKTEGRPMRESGDNRSSPAAGAKEEALARLRALADECGVPGWDAGGARPLHPQAVDRAERLVGVLPEDVPLPEFAPEPDGAVALDWIRTRDRMLSVSVSASGTLAYAWLDGADRGHGIVGFDGQTLPGRLVGEI